MWFATAEGLSRFDGTTFKNFFAEPGNSNSLPDNIINFLCEYKPGHLLLNSGGKLTCLNTLTSQFYAPPCNIPDVVTFMTATGKTGYFVIAADTCYVLNKQLQVTGFIFPPLKRKGTTHIYYLNQDIALTGRINEYYIYNIHDKKCYPLLGEKDMPPRDRILQFHYFDSLHNHLYFSNYFGGIYKYDLSGHLLYNWKVGYSSSEILNGNTTFIVPKNDSILWIGNAEGNGLSILNLHTNHFEYVVKNINIPSSLPNNSVMHNYTDREGNEWIASLGGISKITSTAAYIRKWETGTADQKGIYSPFISIRKGADDNFYIGRLSQPQLWKINSLNYNISEVVSTQMPGVWSLTNFGDDLLVAGGGTTTLQYNPRTKQFRASSFLKKYFPVSDIVILAFKHSNGDEWYSGNNGGGFVRVDAKDKSIHHYTKDGAAGNFTSSYYTYQLEDKNGNLWFGVNKSSKLLHFDLQTQHFTEISFADIVTSKSKVFSGITDLCKDREENIWVAFDGSGIIKYNPVKKEATHYTIANGLPSNYVNSLIFDDKDRLWIGTIKGLACFLRSENRFVSFTRRDGLPDDYFGDRCIYFDSSTHLLWIGSTSTLMWFNPEELLKKTTNEFPLYIDAVMINGKLLTDEISENMSFTPSHNNLQFSFIGLDLENGKNIEYNYILKGTDKEWIDNGSATTASYTNLTPGHYTFIVRARHRGDTGWNIMQQPFSFIVQTPWYETWWFRFSLGVAIALLSWFIIRTYYLRKLERERAIMEKEIAIEQERTKMARDLHDGLGSMLSGVKHSFAAMTKNFQLNEQQQSLFHSNLGKLNESIKELRNISHNMSSDTLIKYGLESSLRDYCNNISDNSAISIFYTALNTENLPLSEEKASHLFRVMQELLQNIIKHSAASNVVVQLSRNNNSLYITVEDNGKGFDLQQVKKQKGMGLKNIESRIRLLKGNLDYQTAPGKGTSVLIEVPL
jgi:signal transduction histidine kinase/streptogramin lyase